jgi:hypothetical protein
MLTRRGARSLSKQIDSRLLKASTKGFGKFRLVVNKPDTMILKDPQVVL